MKKIIASLLNLLLITGCAMGFDQPPPSNSENSLKVTSSSKEESIISNESVISSTDSSTSIIESLSSSSSSSSSVDSSSSSSDSSIELSSSSISSSSSSEITEEEYVGEVLKDTDFNNLDNWILEPNNNEDQLKIEKNGSNSIELKINNSKATNYWDVQMLQNNLNLIGNRTYLVSFKIKSSTSRTFKFIIQKQDYSSLAYEEDIYLTRNQVYEFYKEIEIKESSSYLYGFMLGNVNGVSRSSHTITISNPSLNDQISEFDMYEGRKGTYSEAPQTLKNRNLVWSDEFNGNKLDTNNWSYNKGAGGWGNNEYQYYTDSENNVRVVNGSLRITARKEEYRDAPYTSGRIDTKNKKMFQYGYFEARISLPKEMGIWPAFWMLGDNIDDVNWPKCGEIDIMEAINDTDKVYSTLHWNSNGLSGDVSHTFIGNDDGYNIDDREQYHLYGVEWTENGIKTFVDNVEVFSYSFFNANVKEAFRNEFYFLLNVAVGGEWPGFEIGENFPQTMSVDYLRVYQ